MRDGIGGGWLTWTPPRGPSSIDEDRLSLLTRLFQPNNRPTPARASRGTRSAWRPGRRTRARPSARATTASTTTPLATLAPASSFWGSACSPSSSSRPCPSRGAWLCVWCSTHTGAPPLLTFSPTTNNNYNNQVLHPQAHPPAGSRPPRPRAPTPPHHRRRRHRLRCLLLGRRERGGRRAGGRGAERRRRRPRGR